MDKDYKELKESNLPLLHKKGFQDNQLEISEEDMNTIDRSRWNILLYPFYGLACGFVFMQGTKLLSLPGFFGNPIASEERIVVRQKFTKYFMSNQILFFGVLSGFCLGFVKYEFTKYYLFLKYRGLVNSYMDSCEKKYLNQLKETGQAIEVEINKNLLKKI